MGSQLTRFYDEAKKIGGIKGQMRLAMLTGLPSANAAIEADSPDLLRKFQTALAKVKQGA